MSVAIFTDNDFDKTNGVTTTLKAVLRHAPPDVRLRIYTLSDFGIDEPDYLALRSFGVPIPFYREMRMYVPRLREFRRNLQADGVRLLHLTTPGPAGLAARHYRSRGTFGLVGSFHTNLAQYTAILSGSHAMGGLMARYLRWLYGACETVLVPSCDTRDRLAADGWRRDRLSLWERGVDTAIFSPRRRSDALRERWRVCSRRPAVLYAGRVSREKGLDLLEPLCGLLHRHRVAHRLIVVGDGPMMAELRERCPDAVFTGMLAHDDVAVAMASADVLVFPSATDTASNVVLEAQASGLPVVVADAGGPRENMRDGHTGYVCRAGSPDAFGLRIAVLLADPSRRAAMGAAARALAERRTWPMALSPLYDVYRSALRVTAPSATDLAAAFPAKTASVGSRP